MNGDADPEHMPMPLKDLLSNLAAANLISQAVPQTFAQKQGPLLLSASVLGGASVLAASVNFGLLFAGRGKTVPLFFKLWGAKEDPQVQVKVDLTQVLVSLICAGAVTYITANLYRAALRSAGLARHV